MKKNLFILAVAGLALASCSSDETTASQATSQANEISFRPLMNNVTRAVDINSASDLTSFNVTAFRATTPSATEYFAGVKFTGPTTYTSTPKYYWPTENVNFYAWSAHSGNTDAAETVVTGATEQVTGTYNAIVVTPAADASQQADLIYAKSLNTAKAASIPLAFSHAESRIVLKVKNTSANISFAVTGWRLGFMVPNGTYNGSIETPTWSSLGSATANNVYTNTFSSQPVSGNTTTAALIPGAQAQIMIPQTITPVSAYAGNSVGDKPNSAYIAIQYTATNTSTTEAIVASATWAMWKIPAITWEAGKQYTYTIDLADGGYFETNQNTDDANLDPILGGYIQFASVTVSTWNTTPGEINAGM